MHSVEKELSALIPVLCIFIIMLSSSSTLQNVIIVPRSLKFN